MLHDPTDRHNNRVSNMEITFLKAAIPLRKTFDDRGKHSYPAAYEFTSLTVAVSTLKEFELMLNAQAAIGNCLLKGTLERPLVNESRAGTTDRDKHTPWLCFDADGLSGVADADAFMADLGLSDYSYVTQWSSSAFLSLHGYNDTTFNAHIFVMLSEPVSPHKVKLWLKQKNFTTFSANLRLTASNLALRFGLDITTCQNDKILYIAPPDVHPPYVDTITTPRITYHQGQFNVVPTAILELDTLNPETIKKTEITIINKLREDIGLEKKRSTYFNLKGTNTLYMPNPSHAKITDVKQDRGFTYFNFNGGDSWAYYHPTDNFEFIYNFKGEPTYRTEELLPEYYAFMSIQTGQEKAGGRTAIAFRGLQDGAVYNGFYDETKDDLELHMARKSTDAINFLAEYNIELETLPTYRLTHNPHFEGPRVNKEAKEINLYVQSELERNHAPNSNATPTIDKVIEHVLGLDNVRLFINWLAYVVQYKEASGTGWVFHGSQGTGKGILFHRILRPLIGYKNAVQMRTANFEDSYNGFLECAQLVNVDEVDIPQSRKDQQIMADIKNYMTEPTISIRKMYANVIEVPNRTNWIFSSNKRNPIIVEMTDRRFNIADYQLHPLLISETELDTITTELPAFMHHLLIYPVNERQAKTAGLTSAKVDMQALSETSVDEIANALILGRAHVLYGYCEDDKDIMNLDHKIIVQRYNTLIREVVCEGRDRFTREELRVIFEATVGHVPATPAKFSKYLRHHGLKIGVNRIAGVAQRGITVDWRDSSEWFTRTQREYGVMKEVLHKQAELERRTGEKP